jgi:putative transposase
MLQCVHGQEAAAALLGALYHVISRGNNRQATFLQSEDYHSFLNHLQRVQKKMPFFLYAYCLMPNHFHLLIEVKETPLSEIMQRVLTGYTVYFNRRHRRGGHLFQGRYKAFLCEKDSYLLELVRYIHLNPVRARMVKAPVDWKWSGHGAYLKGGEEFLASRQVLSRFGARHARQLYAAFVRDGMAMGHRKDLYPEDKLPYLGGDEFIKEHRIRHEESAGRQGRQRKRAGDVCFEQDSAYVESPLRNQVLVVRIQRKDRSPDCVNSATAPYADDKTLFSILDSLRWEPKTP